LAAWQIIHRLFSLFVASTLYTPPLMTPSFLPRLLLGASLIGASGFALSAGGAHAMLVCNFDNPLGSPCPTGSSATVGDKKITTIDGPTIGQGDVEFTNPLVTPFIYAVDTDFASELATTTQGTFRYKLEIIHPHNTFHTAKLRWLDGLGAPASSITKSIYNDSSFSSLIGSTSTNDGNIDISGKRIIWVQDTYASGGALDFVRNDYSQVPAPLPLLGAGAVFGACRRLRRLSDRLPRRTAIGSPLA
jgi:hypothetical protein